MVVTSLHDPTADVVIRELHDRGIPVVRLDSGDFPASLSVEAEITSQGIQGRLTTPSRTADLANIRALYYAARPASPSPISESRTRGSPSPRPGMDSEECWRHFPGAFT